MRRAKATDAIRELAVDFANSVECPGCRGGDAFVSPEEARRWIRRNLPTGRDRITAAELPTVRRFRNELRQLLQSAADRTRPPSKVLAIINRAAARAPPHPVLRWRGGGWVSEAPDDGRSPSQRLIAFSARSVIDLLGTTDPTPLRKCQGPGCVHFLVAERSQQRWCSPTGCGNRARVQRHYRKVRSEQRARGPPSSLKTKPL